jgi:UDP-N-acetylmuramate--alanine ligase
MSLPNTRYGATLNTLLEKRKKLWFIGIGGIHMRAIALWASRHGFFVAGSDRVPGEWKDQLREAGIPVYFGHDARRVVDYDAVIYTAAISFDNPEYQAAAALGLPTISRADFLRFLMQTYQNRIAVSGSHGKSTVTAMLAEIFLAAGRDPAVFCGAPLCRRGRSVLEGKGEDFIFEACEYQNSFHCFTPSLAVILNLELDHVDFFKDERALQDSFAEFAKNADRVLVNAEDAAALAAAKVCKGDVISFGVEKGDFFTRLGTFSQGKGSFCMQMPDGMLSSEITLRVPGRHNVINAAAAFSAAVLCGVAPQAAVAGLSAFGGAGRRMEYRGMIRGARMFDDYAHHPSEIRATLSAAREMMGERGRLFAVFQSHTYSRTAAFFAELCAALRLADRVLVAPIYPARETDMRGMSAARLAAGVGDAAAAPGGFAEIATSLLTELEPGDLAVVMGAGDIDRLFEEFSEKHFTL